MAIDRAAELLRARLAELEGLPANASSAEFTEWQSKTTSTIAHTFGADSRLMDDFGNVSFWGMYDETPVQYQRSFHQGRERAIGLLRGAIYEAEELLNDTVIEDATAFDPALWAQVQGAVTQEEWAQVAAGVAVFVEDTLRRWAGLDESAFGVALMTKVLKPDAGAFPLGRTEGEREGWHQFGRGLAAACSNADRHRIQKRDDLKRYALGVLGAASLLLTQLRFEHGNRFIED